MIDHIERPTEDWRRAMLRASFALIVASVLAVGVVQAQTPANPSFEVASVKPNNSGAASAVLGIRGERFIATNIPASTLVAIAYGVENSQITNAPPWVLTEKFDVIGKAVDGAVLGSVWDVTAQVARMVMGLMADRFKLRARKEARDRAIFAMGVARSDGRLGPHLTQSPQDCLTAPKAAPGVAPDSVKRPFVGFLYGPGRLAGGCMSLASLAVVLERRAGRFVADQTGLGGEFDLELSFRPDDAHTDDARPSLFTALQEQIGLKLESTRGPVDVVVIDHVEQPTPD